MAKASRGGRSESSNPSAGTYIMYHGSGDANITQFDDEHKGKSTGVYENMIYFTDSKKFADDFAYKRILTDDLINDIRGARGAVYQAKITLKNPLDFRNLRKKDFDNLWKIVPDYNKPLYKSKQDFIQKVKGDIDVGNHQLVKMVLDFDKLPSVGYDGIIARLDPRTKDLEYGVVKAKQISKVKKIG